MTLPAMDNDDLRRGNQLTSNVGRHCSRGDALLNTAMELMFRVYISNLIISKLRETLPSGLIIAKAAGVNGMIAGQVVDRIAQKLIYRSMDFIERNKTGALICAIIAGLGMAGADL